MTSMSGLDDLKRFFASAPFMVDLGVVPFEAGEGRVATCIELAPRHLQHTGLVHAGVMGDGGRPHDGRGGADDGCRPATGMLTAELKVSLLRAGRGRAHGVRSPGRQAGPATCQLHRGPKSLPSTAVSARAGG
jgi:acyl-coenzyme A thioesterase PaaI-like protein